MKSKIIYPNLNAEIARANMTYETLAQIVGVNRTTLWAKLSGRRSFLLEEALKISEQFPNVNLKCLFKKE